MDVEGAPSADVTEGWAEPLWGVWGPTAGPSPASYPGWVPPVWPPAGALAVVEVPAAIVVAKPPAKDPVEPARAFLAAYTAPTSRRTARQSLDRLALLWELPGWESVPWGRLRAKHTTAVRALVGSQLESGAWGPETAKLTLGMLRGCLAMARRLGHMTYEEYADAIDWPKVRGRALPRGRALSVEEIVQLWRYIDDELPGAYASLVRAVFAVGLGGGLRRDEMARLTLGSLSNDERHLHVIGKGRRERVQRLPEWAADALGVWLTDRPRLEVKTDALFVPISRDGRVRDIPYTGYGLFDLIVSNADAAGLAKLSPHDLRRTFATKLLASKKVSIVQQLMGHADAATTLKYDRTPKEEADAAVDQVLGEGWGPKMGAV